MTPQCAAVLAKLDEIEAEMKRIGFWTAEPPPKPDAPIRTYLDARTFEEWLQWVLLPNARAAARAGSLPATSDVGLMAMRQYDHHSYVEVAQPLLRLCGELDAIVRGA